MQNSASSGATMIIKFARTMLLLGLFWVATSSHAKDQDLPNGDPCIPALRAPGFWESLRHSLSVHHLRRRVDASTLAESEKNWVRQLDQDSFLHPEDPNHDKYGHPYSLAAIESIVQCLENGIQSFTRHQGVSARYRWAPGGYDIVAYKLVHRPGIHSYLIAEEDSRLTTKNRATNRFLIATDDPTNNELLSVTYTPLEFARPRTIGRTEAEEIWRGLP